jgi:hypothetical protein
MLPVARRKFCPEFLTGLGNALRCTLPSDRQQGDYEESDLRSQVPRLHRQLLD